MNVELTRRSFIYRSGAAVAGAYVLLDAVRASAARAAVDGLAGDSTAVVRWNSAALEAVRETHPGPPMVARALAMVHTSIFDAWAAYDANAVGTRLGGSLRRPAEERTDANKREALSYAAYRTLVDLYPGSTQVAQFNSVMASLGYDPANASTDTSTPSGIGNTAAAALLEFRHGDGSNQLGGYADTSGYVPVNDSTHINDPNKWQPLRPAGASADQRYIAPHWGAVTPFALTSGSQLRPSTGPATVGDSLYRQQAQKVLDYSASLNDKRKVIAEYWADGPSSELPPGHWCLFAQYVSQRDGNGLDADVKMFFAMTNAILDASIAAWDAKRAFNSVRPVTAIHYLFANDDRGVGRTLPGDGHDQGKGLAALPGGHRCDAAVPRVPLRPQHVQCRGRRGPQALHGLGRLRSLHDPARRQLAGRARRRAQEGRDPLLEDVQRCRRRGRHLPAVWGHPLRTGRPGRSCDGPPDRCPSLG